MIDSGQFVNGIWVGTVLILLGSFPDTAERMLAALSRLPRPVPLALPQLRRLQKPLVFPRWFVHLGGGLILATLLAYLTH